MQETTKSNGPTLDIGAVAFKNRFTLLAFDSRSHKPIWAKAMPCEGKVIFKLKKVGNFYKFFKVLCVR
jgi:hypothetical protein